MNIKKSIWIKFNVKFICDFYLIPLKWYDGWHVTQQHGSHLANSLKIQLYRSNFKMLDVIENTFWQIQFCQSNCFGTNELYQNSPAVNSDKAFVLQSNPGFSIFRPLKCDIGYQLPYVMHVFKWNRFFVGL